jgi:hypothetical protein
VPESSLKDSINMRYRTVLIKTLLAGLASAACGSSAHSAPPRSVILRQASELEWAPQAPGLPQQLATLWGDRSTGAAGALIKLPGGFDSGLHAHSNDYYGVLIQGTLIHIDAQDRGAENELLPGAYVMQPGMGMHIDRCKPGAECLLFVYQNEKADIILPNPR